MNFHNSCVCLHKTDITACIEEGYSRPHPIGAIDRWPPEKRKSILFMSVLSGRLTMLKKMTYAHVYMGSTNWTQWVIKSKKDRKTERQKTERQTERQKERSKPESHESSQVQLPSKYYDYLKKTSIMTTPVDMPIWSGETPHSPTPRWQATGTQCQQREGEPVSLRNQILHRLSNPEWSTMYTLIHKKNISGFNLCM